MKITANSRETVKILKFYDNATLKSKIYAAQQFTLSD